MLLLLSGAVASGKTSLAKFLVEDERFVRLRTGGFLLSKARAAGIEANRATLQILGDELDRQTDYRWVVDEVALPAMAANPELSRWLLDSVRKRKQVHWFRERFSRAVVHVHLTANEQVLRERYDRRILNGEEYAGNTSYDDAIHSKNEIEARSLSDVADWTVDTSESDGREQVLRILDRIARGGDV